nr:uncharacterized protein LOC112000026 [Quercus suber]
MDTPTPNRVAWHPPPDGYVKINFDGATFKDIKKASLGVVIQDGFGQVLASLSEQIQLLYSSNLVEAMAVARSIYFAAELDFSSFVLEGDSELIIKALKNNEDSLAPFGYILATAKTSTDVNCISFFLIRKLGNSVAHNLAKHARHVAGLKVWMEDVPPHLYFVLLTDY